LKSRINGDTIMHFFLDLLVVRDSGNPARPLRADQIVVHVLKNTSGSALRVECTGAEAAREVLDDSRAVTSMPVEEVGGHLTDHYDPMKKALFLSSENYRGSSLAAVGSGGARSRTRAATQSRLRAAQVAHGDGCRSRCSQISAWIGITLLGFAFGCFSSFSGIAIAIFTVIALFQLITLPVEYDASRRAKTRLFALGISNRMSATGSAKSSVPQRMTYVAAMVRLCATASVRHARAGRTELI
jgi:Zn-dependent membrane protease YugP